MQNLSHLSKATRYTAVVALAATFATAPAVLTQASSPYTIAAYAGETDNTQTETTADGATVTGLKIIEEGKALEITGTGWKHSSNGGSYISVKADKGTTTRDGNGVIAETEANADGTFKLTISFPSTANGYNTDWAVGTTHTLHFLSGSMKEGDVVRSPILKVTVSAEGEDPSTVVDTSDWTELTSEGASMKIQPYKSGEKLRIIGQGWTKKDGASGSVVALKLGSSATAYFERTDNSAQNAYLKQLGQSELGDDHTVWVLLTSDTSAVNEAAGIYQLKDDGSFDLEIEVPEELKTAEAGQYLTVQALSGRFAAGDTKRSAVSNPIPVNGKAYETKSQNTSQQCTTSASAPSMTIQNPIVEAGGKLHLVGSGWCNPDGKGAPRIAVKIDEAKISHLDTAVHSNKTIWAIIDPNETTGEVDTWIQLPAADGSDANMALSEGAHSLRLLSGSLESGDLKATYGGQGVLDFVVGQYKPNAVPDTIANSEMTDATRKGVTVEKQGNTVTVTVPNAQAGQWVEVNPYIGGSVRSNWGSGWVQLDANKQLSYQLPDGLAAGEYKMAVQNGEQDGFGQLLGWDDMAVEGKTGTDNLNNGQGTKIATSLGSAKIIQDSATSGASSNSSSASSSSSNSGSPATGSNGSGNPASVANSSSLSQASSQKTQKVIKAAPAASAKASATAKASASPQPSSSASSSASDKAEERSANKDSQGEETSTASSKKSFWEETFSANNLLMIAAGIIVLLAVLLSPRKKNN